MYEATHYSSTCFTISGSGDITDEFHPGRRVEYATITGSTTISGISTPTVTNSGVTGSGTLISGSLTQNYYEYSYGIIDNSTYTSSGVGYGTTVNLTQESDAVISGSTLYIKYGSGKSGLDVTFPSTANNIPIYKLGNLSEFSSSGDFISYGTITSHGDLTTYGSLETYGDLTTYGSLDIYGEMYIAGSIDVDGGIDVAGTITSWAISGESGTDINEFSTDGTLAGNSDTAVPTEKAVKTYIDTTVSGWSGNIPTISGTITVVNGLITNYV